MEFSPDSIFQRLTFIEQIIKSYQQNNYELQQIGTIFQELQELKISPQIVFQQLIPSKDTIFELKYSLYKQITKTTPNTLTCKYQIENPQKINYNSDSFLNSENASEILRKICAIKGEAMFINQELTVQKFDSNIQDETLQTLKQLSLRKLMKQFMKRCRSHSKLQFLIPLCIRLVVIQQSIMVYLEKSMTFFCSILNQQCDSSVVQEKNTNTCTVKSVSSLSACIEQFLQKQKRDNLAGGLNTSMQVQQCATYQPVIRSDFVFNRNNHEKPYIKVHDRQRRTNCCLWF